MSALIPARRSRVALLAPVVLTLTAPGILAVREAQADPIRYETFGQVDRLGPSAGPPVVRFEGTGGTFDPDSSIPLGRFVIDAPAPGESTVYDDIPLAIELNAPDLDRTISPGGIRTEIDASVVIRGRLGGVIRDGAPGLVATFDSVELGGLLPFNADHIHQYAFPIPLTDLTLPESKLLVIPTDGWVGSTPRFAEAGALAVPEPSMALVFLAGAAGAGLWGRRRN
jgi:hypothetical protein